MQRFIAILICSISFPAAAQARPASLNDYASSRLEHILTSLDSQPDFQRGFVETTELFEQMIAFGESGNSEVFTQVAMARRLCRLMVLCESTDIRGRLWLFLRQNPLLATELARIVLYGKKKEECDDLPELFALLDKLRATHGEKLNDLASLTAAICVVHDRPIKRRMNENEVEGTDPLALFEYFDANQKKMFFGVQNVPSELLIYVVDSTAPIDQMQWALKKFERDGNVGKRFFDIQYDHNHVRTGADKKVTQLGYTLPNIQQYGGVCIDQAYFATQVGKALGIPTAIATALGGETGHAWIGFLQAQGKRGWWNFNAGRYDEYKGLAGAVEDPQTRELIPDSFVSLSAEMILLTPKQRELAVAYMDAAEYLILTEDKNRELPTAPPQGVSAVRKKPRVNDIATQQEFCELAVSTNPACIKAWELIINRAEAGKLSHDDKRRWSDLLAKICGKKYPDFTFAILRPMVASVQNASEQNRIWEAAFVMFKDRPDLAASVRMEQAQMWENAGNQRNAGICYEDIINRFTTAGPFVIPALEKCEQALRDLNMGSKVVQLYADTWRKIPAPQGIASPFVRYGNWYRVGMIYAQKLREAGRDSEAAAVMRKLDGQQNTGGR